MPRSTKFHTLLLGAAVGLLAACGNEPAGVAGNEDVTPIADAAPQDAAQTDAAEDTGIPPLVDVAPEDSDTEDSATVDAGDEPVLCTTDDDCSGQPCVPLSDDGSVGICSNYCELASDCPPGFACTLLRSSGNDSVRICLPQTYCLDLDEDGYGIGPGCDGPDCDDEDDAVNPAARERCDGRDNTCSGEVDDDPQFGTAQGGDVRLGDACETGFPGVCAAGTWACTGGLTVCSGNQAPAAAELCNGLDDTCDGSVDVDSDGNALERTFYRGPEGTLDVGLCMEGEERCEGGAWVVTTEQVVPVDERCDTTDWDCSGAPLDVPAGALQETRDNCGSCGNQCQLGFVCTTGACACPSGELDCTGICRNTMADSANCGACGAVCEGGQVCDGGSCACPFGGIFCDGQCRDPQTNGQHCGTCGNICSGGEVCESGSCGCPVGGLSCNGACRDSMTDESHCGGCGIECTGGQLCDGGSCGCPSGGLLCGGQCRDPQTDEANCGACGAVCEGGQLCNGGSCACPTGQTLCGGVCRNLLTESSNCGTCGNVCAGDLTCSTGTCACPAGRFRCGNACVAEQPGSACYTNTSGTPGVGICEAGSWTCAGNGIACQGQTGPRQRVCNGADDDCSGRVDSQCPTGISLSGATSTNLGDSGGTLVPTSQGNCPAGAVITGFRTRIRNCGFFDCGIYSGDRAYGWQPLCSPISLGSRISNNLYGTTVGAATPLPISTGDGYSASFVSGSCPAGEVAVGIGYNFGEGGHLNGIRLDCARVRLSGSPGSFTPVQDSAGTVNIWSSSGSTYSCPNNGVLTGYRAKFQTSHAHELTVRCNDVSIALSP